ncbi:MAG: hypothetical protein ABFS56_05670 [Pseudomonadota bacterium]
MTNKWKIATATLGLVTKAMAIPHYALAAGDWIEKIKLNGDFRYRSEMIKLEGKDERHRNLE